MTLTLTPPTPAGLPIVAIRRQVFTGNGTYTPHAAMQYCEVEAVGAGGGGGGCATGAATTSAGAAGGGAGGYARKVFTKADIGASKAVAIGTAGTAGTAGNNAGGNGGDTTLGTTLLVAKGGTGGGGHSGAASAIANGGAGGVAGTGDVTTVGEPGASCATINAANGLVVSGRGGNSYFGGGARGVVSATATAGLAAPGVGGGGSGGASYNANGAVAGGAGGAGYLVVLEYCSA